MTTVAHVFAIAVIIIGTTFSVIGVLGFYRFPDIYTRLHAAGKVGIFGVVLFLCAAAATVPAAFSRAILLIAMLLFVGPVTAHALASAARRIGIRMNDSSRSGK